MNAMTTKIGSYVNNAAESARSTVKPLDDARNAAASSRAAAPTRADSATFTEGAVQLSQLESRIGQIPVADHARVAQVRQAIADGTYSVDAQKIAAKMARMEWDLSVK